MKTENIIADVIFGITFSALGFSMIFGRKKIVDALISSNNVFWNTIGFASNEKRAVLLTNIMIPILGAIFLTIGTV
jgi:hypothetical protein